MTKIFASEYEQYDTTQTQQFVDRANAHIASVEASGRRVGEAFFHALAVYLSDINTEQKNGGPFGAVIVEYSGGLDEQGRGIGTPKVVGIGTNHVVPNSDPTAHAEMEAYRDAAQRLGYTDMRGKVLYTSCECCPMCLSVANGCGVSRITYVNDRKQAGAIDFSDDLQYQLFMLPREKQMAHIGKLPQEEAKRMKEALGEHGAVVLDASGRVYATGDTTSECDPTGVPSLNAVRTAVARFAGVQRQYGNTAPVFSLPQGFRLVTRDIPHPAGLVAADWARLSRKINPLYPDNPAYDSSEPDPRRIVHVTTEHEQLKVRAADGECRVPQEAPITYYQPLLSDEQRLVQTKRYTNGKIAQSAAHVFDRWGEDIRRGGQVRY